LRIGSSGHSATPGCAASNCAARPRRYARAAANPRLITMLRNSVYRLHAPRICLLDSASPTNGTDVPGYRTCRSHGRRGDVRMRRRTGDRGRSRPCSPQFASVARGWVPTRIEEFFLPREAGEGDHAKRGGGGGAAYHLSLRDSPLHRPAGGPPPPLGSAPRWRISESLDRRHNCARLYLAPQAGRDRVQCCFNMTGICTGPGRLCVCGLCCVLSSPSSIRPSLSRVLRCPSAVVEQ